MVAGKVMQPFMYDMPVTNQQGQVEYEDVLMFIRDGIKFVQNFAGIIDKSTPHVYLSALPFSPCKSMLAKCLATSFSGVAQVAVGQHDDWPRIQHALQGHTSSVLSVAFSPHGRHIMSGSCDETIRLWDAQTGGQVGNPLQGHTDSVLSVAFSPDGRHIVSGSSDETIQPWDAQTGGQDKGQTTKTKLITPSPIHFSSSAAHALKDAQSLFIDMSSVKQDSRDLVCSHNAPALSHTTRTDEADNRPCYMTS